MPPELEQARCHERKSFVRSGSCFVDGKRLASCGKPSAETRSAGESAYGAAGWINTVELSMASSLNEGDVDRISGTETLVTRKTLHTITHSMRTAVHRQRLPARLALVACVVAVAIPALVAFSREVDAASNTTETPVAVAAPAAIAAPWSSDTTHSLSMLIVGTLLISAGSALRRAA